MAESIDISAAIAVAASAQETPLEEKDETERKDTKMVRTAFRRIEEFVRLPIKAAFQLIQANERCRARLSS